MKITLVDTGLKTIRGDRIKHIEQFIDSSNFMLMSEDKVTEKSNRRFKKKEVIYRRYYEETNISYGWSRFYRFPSL